MSMFRGHRNEQMEGRPSHMELRGFVFVVDEQWGGALIHHPCQDIVQDLVIILDGYAKIFQLFSHLSKDVKQKLLFVAQSHLYWCDMSP